MEKDQHRVTQTIMFDTLVVYCLLLVKSFSQEYDCLVSLLCLKNIQPAGNSIVCRNILQDL